MYMDPSRERSQKSTTMPGATPATVPGTMPTTTTTVPGATPATVPGTTMPMPGATPAMPTGTMMPGTTFTDATPDSAMPMGSGALGIEGGDQGSVLLGSSSSEGGVSWLANMATGDAASAAAAPLVASAQLVVAPLATLLCGLHLWQLLL